MRFVRPSGFAFLLGLSLALACSSTDSGTTPTADGGTSTTTGDDGGTATTTTDGSTTTVTSDAGGGVAPAACTDAGANYAQVVCAASAFLATLTTAEQATVVYDWSNAAAKTVWSNLPGVTRNGIKLGALGTTSRAAALALAQTVLTTQGYGHLVGVLAGDDYLKSMSTSGGGGPGGGAYSSDNYSIAFIGTPSTTSDWMIQIGGHHMAYNITYRSGVGYPVPHHLGVEPKAAFTVTGNYAGTYQPLADKADAMFGIFGGFTAAQLTSGYLSGQTFADVLLGPLEYGTGSEAKVVYPTQTGVLVSSLPSAQQDLVTAAIKTWVQDYDASIADPLLAEYTSATAYAQTYLAYGAPSEGSPNPDVNTTYLRIDGPRVWLELSCQAGVVIQNVSHFHTIFRDKTEDYGASL